MTIEQQVELLWQSIQHGEHAPQALRGTLSIDDAYRIQLGLLERFEGSGEKHVGWKVGLTAPAIQAQLDFHEPVFGFLLESGRRQSDTQFAFDSLIQPGFENELCLTLNDTLAGPGVTLDQARAAISSVAPAIEIIEKRCGPTMDIALMLADNAQQHAFVTGAECALDGVDFARATVEVSLNNVFQERADGAQVQGTSVASVQWLANKLAQFDRKLEAGACIMSGSFTRQYDLDRGDLVEAKFDPFGAVSARFR